LRPGRTAEHQGPPPGPYDPRSLCGQHRPYAGHRGTATANPPPGRRDGRTREHRAWQERQIEGYGIVLDLVDGGSLRAVEETCGKEGEYP